MRATKLAFMHRCITFFALAILLAPTGVRADEPAAPTPAAMSAAEQKFVTDSAATLNRRYPTPQTAEKAGYVRYTNEDATGAISYAGKHWESTTLDAPSQLWYDVKGRLLGADYSVLVAGHPTAPALFGIASSRFGEENAHIHYVLKNADGTFTYSRAVGAKKYAAAGLDPAHPSAAGLVKVGAVKDASQVATVFLFPTIWDVTVWVLPNPDGAFADKNPNVKPSKAPAPMDMH